MKVSTKLLQDRQACSASIRDVVIPIIDTGTSTSSSPLRKETAAGRPTCFVVVVRSGWPHCSNQHVYVLTGLRDRPFVRIDLLSDSSYMFKFEAEN